MAKRILIADDSVTILKAFTMTFGAEDVALTPTRSADEGLNLARQTRPDLIIADGAMPGRSGYELCQLVKSDPGLRSTAVYILASAQQPYDEARGRQAGVDGHLLKPWDTGNLIEKVRDAMARGVEAMPMPAATPSLAAPARATPARMVAAAAPAPSSDDDYGEIDVETPPPVVTAAPAHVREPVPMPHVAPAPAPMRPAAAPVHAVAAVAHAPAPAAPSGQAAPSMRPSLIPGVRPGAVPPARPGTSPVRPVGPSIPPGGLVPPRPAAPPVARTLVGLPAANAPLPGSMRPGSMVPAAVPAAAAVAPAPAPRPPAAPPPAAARPAMSHAPAVAAAVSSAVDQRMAAVAARGPEYEAIAKLSREIIEQIVWEVVPELAEAIIREHLEKRGTA